MIEKLLQRLCEIHFVYPPATPAEIEQFELRVGWRLDPELRQFYLRTNGARLFSEIDCPFHILPLDKIVRARVAVFGKDSDEYGPPTWWIFAKLHDGNYLAIDSMCVEDGNYAVRDIFHETANDPAYCKIIAISFADFLARALNSDGQYFWLSESFDLSPTLWSNDNQI